MNISKLYCQTLLLMLSCASLALCQETTANAPKRQAQQVAGKAKRWFKRHPSSNVEKTKEQALKTPTGSPVRVKLTDGTNVKGALTKVTDEGIGVTSGKAAPQAIAYNRISNIKKTRGRKVNLDGSPDTRKLDASLSAIPKESPVKLKLADKSKLSGRYLGKTQDSVEIQTPEGNKMTDRTIPKEQIASIRAEKPGLFRKPKLQAPDLVQKNVSGVPLGSPVDVKTPDGRDVSGKLTGRTDNGFSMQTLDNGAIVNKDVSYDQVAGVKRPKTGIKERIPGLHPPALQSDTQVKTAAMGIPTGSPITLQLPDGRKTTGKLMGVTNDGMQVQSLTAGQVVTQNVGFDQIGSLKQGVPLTPTDRAKKAGKSAALVVVTGMVSGALANAF